MLAESCRLLSHLAATSSSNLIEILPETVCSTAAGGRFLENLRRIRKGGRLGTQRNAGVVDGCRIRLPQSDDAFGELGLEPLQRPHDEDNGRG